LIKLYSLSDPICFSQLLSWNPPFAKMHNIIKFNIVFHWIAIIWMTKSSTNWILLLKLSKWVSCTISAIFYAMIPVPPVRSLSSIVTPPIPDQNVIPPILRQNVLSLHFYPKLAPSFTSILSVKIERCEIVLVYQN